LTRGTTGRFTFAPSPKLTIECTYVLHRPYVKKTQSAWFF
jgi:hypothetical protein